LQPIIHRAKLPALSSCPASERETLSYHLLCISFSLVGFSVKEPEGLSPRALGLDCSWLLDISHSNYLSLSLPNIALLPRSAGVNVLCCQLRKCNGAVFAQLTPYARYRQPRRLAIPPTTSPESVMTIRTQYPRTIPPSRPTEISRLEISHPLRARIVMLRRLATPRSDPPGDDLSPGPNRLTHTLPNYPPKKRLT